MLDEYGDVYGCGFNGVGQLGLGRKRIGFSPTKLDEPSSPVSSISAG